MERQLFCFVALTLACVCSCRQPPSNAPETVGMDKQSIKLTSAAFTDGGLISAPYTCDGANVSPPLSWTGVPAGAKSLALVCEDPDAPKGTWTHWILFNLPASTRELKENVPAQTSLPDGAQQGINDFGKHGYGGPCPPGGTHRYYFKLYALNTTLDLHANASTDDLRKAMLGHILDQGQLMSRYKK